MNFEWLVAHLEHVRVGIYGPRGPFILKTLEYRTKVVNINIFIFRSSSFSLRGWGPLKKALVLESEEPDSSLSLTIDHFVVLAHITSPLWTLVSLQIK